MAHYDKLISSLSNDNLLYLKELTPKGPRVFLLKIASKQPLLKAIQIVQN
jgi:hypothetical protein